MGLGRRKRRQDSLWVAKQELPRTGGHVFYERVKGHDMAQYSLGVSYEIGEGVSQLTISTAVKWYQLATDQGNVDEAGQR